MDNRRSTGIITSIQLLRIIAAVAVVIVHAAPGFKVGPSGVDIFFAISGFVILISSRHLFGTKGGCLTFLKNRIIRVVPLYWVATALSIAIVKILYDVLPPYHQVVTSLFFIPFFDQNIIGKYLPVLLVGWTLNYEMFFYAVFTAFVALTMRVAIIAIVTVLSVLVFTPVLAHFPALSIYWSGPMLIEFIFGMVIALIYLQGFRLPLPVGALAIIAGAATIYLYRESGNNSQNVYRLLMWGLPAALIVGGAGLTKWPSAGARAVKIIQYLGAASYAVYLFHDPVIMLTEPLPLFAKVLIAVVVGIAIHAMEKFVHRSIRTSAKRIAVDKDNADRVIDKAASRHKSGRHVTIRT